MDQRLRDRHPGTRARWGSVTETASLVVGADGKHSFVADAVASPRYRKRPTATFASYSYWADVPMTSGELYQRPERAAAAFPTNDGLTMVYVAAPIREFASLRRNIEGHFLRTVDGCGDLGERLRAGARVERIRTTPDLPNWLRIPSGPGWALAGDAGLVMDPVTAHGMSNAFADADLLAAAITTGFGGRASLAHALGHYRANRDGRAVAMYDFTVSLAALHRRSSLPLLLHALAGRPDEIDRLLATFAGVVPVDRYFSVRNLLPLLGPARMLRVAMRDRRRTRPPSWDGEMAADGNDRWAPNSRIPLRAASGSHRPSVGTSRWPPSDIRSESTGPDVGQQHHHPGKPRQDRRGQPGHGRTGENARGDVHEESRH